MLDDQRLDELLGASSPVISKRTGALAAAMDAVGTEARGSRVRRRHWITGAGVIGALVVASVGTSTAVALPAVRVLLGWEVDRTITYRSEIGGECTILLGLDYQQWRNGLTRTEAEMYAVAMSAADGLDLSPAGLDRIVADARSEIEPNDPFSPLSLPPVDFEEYAVGAALGSALDEAFASNGIVLVGRQLRITCQYGDSA
jgi:hypothetical protein